MENVIRFHSKIFDSIEADGAVQLEAERKIRWFRRFDLQIKQDGRNVLSILDKGGLFRQHFIIQENKTDFKIELKNQKIIFFNGIKFEIKSNKFYPFKKKYAQVFVDELDVGNISFLSKFFNIKLQFTPSQELRDEYLQKVAILILFNIADLDGSE